MVAHEPPGVLAEVLAISALCVRAQTIEQEQRFHEAVNDLDAVGVQGKAQ